MSIEDRNDSTTSKRGPVIAVLDDEHYDDGESEREVAGERLLSAVERLVDDPDSLIAQVEAFKQDTFPERDENEAYFLEAVSKRLIANFSNKSAIAGGATALPAIFPGGGTMLAIVGGSLADMAFMLKHEVEMALCLTHLHGYDIREESERWLAYALVAVNIYEAKSGRSYFSDIAEAQLEALARYTPRQLTKLVATVLGKVAILAASKNLVKALPLVGVVVSASANKLLTGSVGWRCAEALARRRAAEDSHDEPVVDAKVT
jgi:uncharacterized protein (DUF697 family)